MSASDETTEEQVLKAVKNLGADMVDVLDAIHSSYEVKLDFAEMKGHLDLTTAITLSERIGVSTSDLGIEVMIPDVKTVKEIQDPKKTDSEKETADKDEKSETKPSESQDPCEDKPFLSLRMIFRVNGDSPRF